MLSLLTSVVSPVLFIGITTHSEWQHKLKVQAIRSNCLSRMGGKAFASHEPLASQNVSLPDCIAGAGNISHSEQT